MKRITADYRVVYNSREEEERGTPKPTEPTGLTGPVLMQ